MALTDVRLQHFRSYTDAAFEFSPSVNIIVGPNGSGKTNLLEAVLVLALGSSYRAHDADLIEFEQSWARLDADMDEPAASRVVKLQTQPRLHKTYELNSKLYQRLTLAHTLPVVLFEPNHLNLLHGPPEIRRNYLDDLLEQTIASYSGWRRTYRRLLSQRNALLRRSLAPAAEELFPWNLRLSELGASIARARAELVEAANQSIDALYSELSHTKSEVRLQYQPSFELEAYESHMLHKLETHAHIDAERGFTAYGPHREDFATLFRGHSVETMASRGETRTAILALKIIELQFIEKARGTTPLLLLDDVFSELDGARRQALTGFVQKYQTFITTTDADLVVHYFIDQAKIKIIPL
jgi:DNA replication and repair protein RecF